MNVQLPLPNPQDWVGIPYVMTRCGVTRQTVYRWCGKGSEPMKPPILTPHTPQGAEWIMFWRDDVERIAAARSVMRGEGYTATEGFPAASPVR